MIQKNDATCSFYVYSWTTKLGKQNLLREKEFEIVRYVNAKKRVETCGTTKRRADQG